MTNFLRPCPRRYSALPAGDFTVCPATCYNCQGRGNSKTVAGDTGSAGMKKR